MKGVGKRRKEFKAGKHDAQSLVGEKAWQM